MFKVFLTNDVDVVMMLEMSWRTSSDWGRSNVMDDAIWMMQYG